jgi:hypothetical protein
MNRRQALALLAALPVATRLEAQTRATARHRVFFGGGHGLSSGPTGCHKHGPGTDGNSRRRRRSLGWGTSASSIIRPSIQSLA